MSLESTLGKNIKEAREKAHLTQEELGKAFGKSKWTVLRIEQDKAEPSYAELKKIAQVLGVTTEELIAHKRLSDFIPGSDVTPVRPSEGRHVPVPLLSRELTACCGSGIPMYDEVHNPPVKTYSYTISELGGRYDEMRPPVAVYADGACLERSRIQDGDILVINPALEPRHLQICVVIWRGALSAKRVSLNPDGSVDLRSDFDTYHIDAKEAADPDQFAIWGPVVEVRHGLI